LTQGRAKLIEEVSERSVL